MLSHDSRSQKLAIGLTILAGFVDALGYLTLNGVFVSFMSGNSTRFAVGLVEEKSIHLILLPLGIIALFVVGVMIGRAVRHFLYRKPSTAVLLFVSLSLTMAALLHAMAAVMPAVSFLAIGMGALNNVFFQSGEVSVGVTYMTGTLVKFGQRFMGSILEEKDHNWLPYLLLWIGLVSGAILGSIGFSFYGLHILWVGIAVCFAFTAICANIETAQGWAKNDQD